MYATWLPSDNEVPDRNVNQFDSISDDTDGNKTNTHGSHDLGIFFHVRFLALGQELGAFFDEFQWSLCQFVDLVILGLFSCFGHFRR